MSLKQYWYLQINYCHKSFNNSFIKTTNSFIRDIFFKQKIVKTVKNSKSRKNLSANLFTISYVLHRCCLVLISSARINRRVRSSLINWELNLKPLASNVRVNTIFLHNDKTVRNTIHTSYTHIHAEHDVKKKKNK